MVTSGMLSKNAMKPSKADIADSVRASTQALERVQARLVKPGVRLYARKDVPLFHVDETDPHKFVRKLNGRRDVGVIENGVFKVTG